MKAFVLPVVFAASLSGFGCSGPTDDPADAAMLDVVPTSIVGSVAILDTVSSLRNVSGTALNSKNSYVLRGYYAAGDTSQGTLNYDPSSTAADDGIFVFKPNSVNDAGRFIRSESGLFDARKGGLKMDGTPGQFAKLAAIYQACNAQGKIDKLWLGPGTLDVSDAGALTPGLAPHGASKSIGIFGAGILATTLVGAPHGQLGSQFGIFTALERQDTADYGPRTWTQDLSGAGFGISGAGVTVFPNVGSVAGLAAGDWIFVRLGADPTDGNASYEMLITQIASITGNDVTITTPVRERVPNVQGINTHRTWNKHDFIKINGLFNGFELADLSLDNVLISSNTTIGTYIHDIRIPYGTATFSNVQDENTVLERVTADLITGADLGGGGAASHYGWFYQGWTHLNTVLRDIHVGLLDGVYFFGYEGQSRGMSVENVAVNIDSRSAPSGFSMISNSTPGVPVGALYRNLQLSGYGSALIGPLDTIEGLSISGSPALPNVTSLNMFVSAGQVNDSLRFYETNYDQVVQAAPMLVPLTPNAVISVPFSVRGLPRHVRIRPSAAALAGIADLTQRSGIVEMSIKSSLVPEQFSESNISSVLDVNFPGGGVSESQKLIVYTNANVTAGSYLEVESEFWTSPSSRAAQPPAEISGIGVPALDADFIGQRYFDAGANKLYEAVHSGSGAADWVAL